FRVTPTRRTGDFAVNRQLPRVALQPPGAPELCLAHKRLQGAGSARHRPVQCTTVRKQADNTADSVPRDSFLIIHQE
ncbi:MAG: hypothetical protein PHI97_15005, partial [Desulfobulbus sp.]|nr:hypothetical protein [Desulfobulbus sp.]